MKDKNRIECSTLWFWLVLVIFMPCNLFAQKKDLSCYDWKSKVYFNKPLVLVSVKNKTQEDIFFGIDCLLQLKGKKAESNVGGASSGYVSRIFGATSVEVAALYYVSYLFYQKWDHADAPFLVDKRKKLNSNKSVSMAYKAYEKWLRRVKELGLEEARRQKLDPLAGSGVKWY